MEQGSDLPEKMPCIIPDLDWARDFLIKTGSRDLTCVCRAKEGCSFITRFYLHSNQAVEMEAPIGECALANEIIDSLDNR